ncbi:ABC transporter permease [Granulicella sibirica]|uniref:ABC efflux pump, inner membrane subunit n=1 Tax=Granulicella sibirica TaxID=2479048 RepID=A0A4Q0T244_9BACT|nr:ABC transporter permease [Granulicella sibirica]RXH56892.1 ABC efflux pump, inner membrane subunit [Granulicella sibirica]
MSTFLQHLRYAVRQLRLAPVFTATVILTLALGIGATTAIFTLVHAVMLRSLPVADPATLYRIGDSQECCVQGGPREDGRWGIFSYELVHRIKSATPEFEELAAFQAGQGQFSVRRGGTSEPAKPLHSEYVTGNYFSMFGIQAFAGRVFTPSDDRRNAPPTVVMSYRVWQQTYGADPRMVGSTLMLEGHPFTLIGIAPPGFFGDTLSSSPPSLWIPLEQEPLLAGESSFLEATIPNWLRIIGRIKPGASVEGMSARLTTVLQRWIPDSGIFALVPAAQMAEAQKMFSRQHVVVIPGGSGIGAMKEDYGKSLKILLFICALVLLIACANIANLLLARSTVRRHQTSLQLALGASRQRLIMAALTESVVLALAGGVAGVAVAYAGTRLVLWMAFRTAHFLPISAAPSLPVLGFAFGLSLFTGVLFGTAPAWLATHASPVEALRGANRSTRDSSALPQKALVVTQVVLSVVLLTGAGMLTHSLRNLEHRDFGLDMQDRVAVEINQPPATYSPPKLQALNAALQTRLQELPGVERAALAMYTPYTDNWGEGIVVEGKPPDALGTNNGASWDRVSAGYFEAVGQSILRGRGIGQEDTATTRPVAVINQAFAKRFFDKEDPIGHRFGMDIAEYAGSYEVVGIVHDANYSDLEGEPRPMFFLPLTQSIVYKEAMMQKIQTRSFFIGGAVLKTHTSLATLEPQVRKAIAEVDPDLTVTDVLPIQEQVAANFDQQRTVAQLAGMFSLLALVLAAIGLYGVTAYTVARRTGEIGVRMALGANRAKVLQLVLRGALTQTVVGLAIGIPIAIGGAKLTQLYKVNIWDPTSLTISVAMLLLSAFVAAAIPARRAASIDPMQALRTE